jgi:excinuclease ABC subunit A
MSIDEMIEALRKIKDEDMKTLNGKAVKKKILEELDKFYLIGLSYLHLNRNTGSLSGGENQRLSLMTQMNLGLGDVVLILDEPTMGMHQKEKENLTEILIELKKNGNTIIIVEHDEELITIADKVIDLGPGAGVEGGEIVFNGTLDEIKNQTVSLTGQYLSHRLQYPKKM